MERSPVCSPARSPCCSALTELALIELYGQNALRRKVLKCYPQSLFSSDSIRVIKSIGAEEREKYIAGKGQGELKQRSTLRPSQTKSEKQTYARGASDRSRMRAQLISASSPMAVMNDLGGIVAALAQSDHGTN